MNRIPSLFFALLYTLIIGVSTDVAAQAQTLDDLMADPPSGNTSNQTLQGRVRLFDSILVHPLPDWTPKEIQANPTGATRFNRQLNDNAFRLEMVPKDESLSDWRNLYAIMGFRGVKEPTEGHVRKLVSGFQRDCNPSNLNIRPVSGNANAALLIAACGSLTRQSNSGEVAAFLLLRRDETVVRLFRVWRGPAFRSEDPGQWPVTPKSFDRVVNAMIKSRLLPAAR